MESVQTSGGVAVDGHVQICDIRGDLWIERSWTQPYCAEVTLIAKAGADGFMVGFVVLGRFDNVDPPPPPPEQPAITRHPKGRQGFGICMGSSLGRCELVTGVTVNRSCRPA